MVVVSHCGLGKWVPGGFGVTIFFFLKPANPITTSDEGEHAKTGTLSLNDFYIRRCLRILPPSFIVIAIRSTCPDLPRDAELGGESSPMSHTSPITMECFGGRSDIPGLENILWSLAVEEHFDMVFPFALPADTYTSRSRPGTLSPCCSVGRGVLWRMCAGILFPLRQYQS